MVERSWGKVALTTELWIRLDFYLANNTQTYPILVLLGIAIVFPVSFGIHYLATSPDINILRKGRNLIFRGDISDDNENNAHEETTAKERDGNVKR